MKEALIGTLITLAATAVTYFTNRFISRHKIEVVTHWFNVAWLILSDQGELNEKGTPHGFLILYLSISTSGSKLLSGKRIEVFYRKNKKEEWKKLILEADVAVFRELYSIPEVRKKQIHDPVNFNLMSTPIEINAEKSVTGYLIFPLNETLAGIRLNNQELLGLLRFVIHTPNGRKYEKIIDVRHTEHISKIDYSPLP